MLLVGIAAVMLLAVGVVAALPASDLRPDALRAGIDPAATAKGRQLLDRLAGSYGGVAAWKAKRSTEITFADQWPQALLRVMGPWQASNRLRLTYANGTDDARLDFLDGPNQGAAWGLQQWAAYRVPAGGKPVFAPDRDVKFWVPTTQWFYDAAFRLTEADVVAYGGELAADGRTFDLVFASWGRAEPQRDVDQYLLYIGRDDGLLHHLRYTVREAAQFFVGCVRYEDVREVEGIRLPFRLTFGHCPAEPELLHQQVVESVRFLDEGGLGGLVPDPSQRGSKGE
jgi:hypothetical protein